MTRTAVLAALSAILLLAAAPAAADMIVAEPGGPDSYSLQEVMDAGGIRVGILAFTDFRVVSAASEGGSAPGPGDIMLSGTLTEGEYGLSFNGSWAAADGGRADTTLGFKVAADDPLLLHDNSLWISAYGATAGGMVLVTENVWDMDPLAYPSQAHALANKLVYYRDDSDYDVYDHKVFRIGDDDVCLPEIWVVKDIHVVSEGDGSTAGTSEVHQSFSTIPEPAALTFLAPLSISLLKRRGQ